MHGITDGSRRAPARLLRRVGFAAVVASVLGGCAASDRSGPCTMQEVGEIAVLSDRGLPFVPVTVNGHKVAFLVDTGSFISTIDPAAAVSLGLSPAGSNHFGIAGIDGELKAAVVPVHDLEIGSLRARDVTFAAAGHFGKTIQGLPIVGLFGADFLSNYDVELDLPNRRIGLYVEAGACGTSFDPWDVAASSVHFRLDPSGHAIVPIGIDGASVEAVLDTGAQISVLDPSDAHAAGASDAVLASDRSIVMRGIASMQVQAKLHRFSSMRIGDIETGSIAFAVMPADDPLLGENWLRHHTVWISYPHDLLLVQEQPGSAGAH